MPPNLPWPWPGAFCPAVAVCQAGGDRGTVAWAAAGLEGGGAAPWAGPALLRVLGSPVGLPGAWGCWGPGSETRKGAGLGVCPAGMVGGGQCRLLQRVCARVQDTCRPVQGARRGLLGTGCPVQGSLGAEGVMGSGGCWVQRRWGHRGAGCRDGLGAGCRGTGDAGGAGMPGMQGVLGGEVAGQRGPGCTGAGVAKVLGY